VTSLYCSTREAPPRVALVQEHLLILAELVVNLAVGRAELERQLVGHRAALVVPSAEIEGLHERAADRPGERIVMSRARVGEEPLELAGPAGDAGPRRHHALIDAEVAAELMIDRLAEAGDFAARPERVDELRSAER